ncbi:MAG: hypothetical protein A3H57_00540 [Candidatus Taylorbacteria bacterium RIFCSPLOWO2_02_FULL_43_11]|uniref:Uncharacterized protein n=1 Tax=Candidatus Taylorbacteria bacterium RIFCSPHIGHO2_02_FULL_43_32b TaxID=1802306 RepID=A0A1G2MJV6_9BACT|nr:MAG: hypothetical protein A2743_00530 [Candidatus Taylorbacteria bacterium RIFCSPHIGHO2_01_FULL_43_47]OHA24210.1 MAG: hypothetical protein A3C72_04925 [Candidatus Taylorbacteria bacterium RIFCSPHIGHO2_02_FULL_43_32b]OHA31252.1 MAG: hypothetical protein A3B08_00245 [Candidatus Taylorbacteria bacterium RIFCSPLOWO2_01_FULL_43_44]OHA37822.1 MAG: hypothetical protein A3H57_00540 [Candidatus Taylorbacteria bacterium RIFCSPLOWO2_02_FULL_43_11]
MHLDLKDQKVQMGIAAVIFVLIFMGWFIFFRGKEDDSVLTEVSADPIEKIIGRELLASLESMKGVSLDTSLFERDVFKSFQDFSVDVPQQPFGRRDPFAPIGFEVSN